MAPARPRPSPAAGSASTASTAPSATARAGFYRFAGSEDGGEPAGDYIITNAHVVRDVGETERIQVTLFDHTVVTAEVVGEPDDKTDVAVLKLSEPDPDLLHPAATGPEPVEQGEIVFAFGSPFGSQFSFSMSQGIVSAVGREVGIIGGGGRLRELHPDRRRDQPGQLRRPAV